MSTMRAILQRSFLVLACLVLPAHAPAAIELQSIFGTFVGTAEIRQPSGEIEEMRDIDVMIGPHKSGGFRIEWINVSLVDGRRDVPGVKRRVGATMYQKSEDGDYWVEDPGYNPFRTSSVLAPIKGDPVRWAVLDEDGLHLFVFVILEEEGEDYGAFELQRVTRRPTEAGITLDFVRIVDGTVVRLGDGHGVRVD